MTSITSLDTKNLAEIIAFLANESISDEACYELAYFLEDAFYDGIEIERLKLIIENAYEYATLNDLMENYLDQEQIDEIKKECEEHDEDFEQAIKEQLMEECSCTVLSVSDGYLVIE